MREDQAVTNALDVPFRFRVKEAWTGSGRGTVLVGHVESGAVQPGDDLLLVRGDDQIAFVCGGASPIREAGWQKGDPVLVGLLAPSLTPGGVTQGDLVVSAV